MRRAVTGRRSSVVERTLGKGEVESSILSGGTIFFQRSFNRFSGLRAGIPGANHVENERWQVGRSTAGLTVSAFRRGAVEFSPEASGPVLPRRRHFTNENLTLKTFLSYSYGELESFSLRPHWNPLEFTRARILKAYRKPGAIQLSPPQDTLLSDPHGPESFLLKYPRPLRCRIALEILKFSYLIFYL